MKRPALIVTAALAVSLTACDKLPDVKKKLADLPLVGKYFTEGTLDTAAVRVAAESARADSARRARADSVRRAVAQAQQQTQPAATPARQPTPPAATRRPAAAATRSLVDEPWFPTDTGTVRPGMTRDQVVSVWGAPVAERFAGTRGYLYYRNGCEVSCGTFDVVFLENGQVVDAIVRGRGHTYAGTSSSPPNRTAEYTPPRRPPEPSESVR